MSDLMTRLAGLHHVAPGAVDDDAVAADLLRGHNALITRRRRRAGLASAATLGVVAIGSLSYALGSGDGSRTPQAAAAPASVSHGAGTSSSTTPPAATEQPAPAVSPAIELAAYRGQQLPGYTVREVPQGYVLQGISASVLDIAKQGDHSSLDSFVGKMVVMLSDHPGPDDGQAVSVNGHPGRIGDQGGVLALTWNDGEHNVEVQSWSNIDISREQLVQFADGITILPSAQEGHG